MQRQIPYGGDGALASPVSVCGALSSENCDIFGLRRAEPRFAFHHSHGTRLGPRFPRRSSMSTQTLPGAAVGPRMAYLLAAASTIIYSSPPVVTRAVSVGVPPLALSLSRWLIALVILLPIV